MGSLRRTKNFATDPQTPMFLYSILKQLDLRSINWNDVADALGISNGHAARMRYSRMKSQFEGLSNEPKPPRPKKENTGETKSSKSKAKNNKRLLMEDENERLTTQRASSQQAMSQDPKRIKVEPQSYMNPWNPTGMLAGQPYAAPYWIQPTIKPEPDACGSQSIPLHSVVPSPAIKKEPESSAATVEYPFTASPSIKQEPSAPTEECEMLDSNPIVVKTEPGTALSVQPAPTTAYTQNFAHNYPLSRTVNTYFDRQQLQMAMPQNSMPLVNAASYPTSYTLSDSSYMQGYGQHHNQTSNPWAMSGAAYGTTAHVANNVCNNMMLNPYAATYQDMLNMPLHRRSPSIMQIPDPNHEQIRSQASASEEQPILQQQKETNIDPVGDPQPDSNQAMVSNIRGASIGTSTVPPETPTAMTEAALPNTSNEQPTAVPTVIEVDSDADDEPHRLPTPAAGDAAVTNVRKEVVEL